MSNLALAVFVLLPVLLVSMSVHEMMHAFTANWLGDDTARLMGRLTLNPLKHIDPFFTVALPMLLLLSNQPMFGAAKPVQVDFNRLRFGEFGGALVGMIGPLTNLLIAVVAALLFRAVGPAINSVLHDVFLITIVLNCGLFIFNSIPWPPLDGSRLLYAFAPRPVQEVMTSIERTGIFGLFLFILLFLSFGSSFGDLIIRLSNFLAPGLVT